MNNLLLCEEPYICLIRHGETEFTAARRYNGMTDVPLTANGEQVAERLRAPLSAVRWNVVLCSPLRRARRTAELGGFADPEVVPGLRECDYGELEGQTTEQITASHPGWDFWRDGCPGGETAEAVADRLAPLIERLRHRQGRVLVFSHSHVIRIFGARWLELSARAGAMFALAPAHLNVVGVHRGVPTLELWNDGSSTP